MSELEEVQLEEETPKIKKNGEVISPIEADARSISEWFQEFGGMPAMQVKVTRVYPRAWRGKQVGGLLDVFTQPFSEEELKERYGGGKYEIRVLRQNKRGGWAYAGQRTIEIAGEPIVQPSLEPTIAPVVVEGEGVQQRALGLAERAMLEDRKRSERLEQELMNRSALDPELIKVFTSPLQAQIESANRSQTELRQQLEARNKEILELLSKKPEPSTADKLVEKMLLEEQARMIAVRTAHESELRQLRESSTQDVKRSEDRADRILEQNERAHQREIDSIKRAYEGQIENLKVSYEARLDTVKSDNSRLSTEIKSVKEELIILRDKKEASIEDTIAKAVQIKELLGSLSGDEPQSIGDRLLESVMPVLEGIGTRIATTPSTVPISTPPILQEQVKTQPKQVARKTEQIAVDPQELQAAIQLIETSISNGTEPDAFAQSVRNMVPTSIVELLKSRGVDQLIDGVMQANQNTPMGTPAGRAFLRKVAKILVATDKAVAK